jgi:putative endonuclease
MYYAYILQSLKDKRTYAGYCEDIDKRLAVHNSGKVKATKNRRPFIILMTEQFQTEKEAKDREKYWKSGSGRRRLKQLFKHGLPPTTPL